MPNGHKIDQMAKNIPHGQKYITISAIARPSKIYPNWNFWFQKLPSGNRALIAASNHKNC
jgi:hypothetical protein